jgi:hypothetical protein
MKKLFYAFLIFFFVINLLNISYSQDVTPKKNKAFIGIDVSGSYSIPLLDMKASDGLKGFWNLSDYGVSKAFGASIRIKFSVYTDKMVQLRPYILLGYNHFSNDDSRANIVSYPYTGTTSLGWPYTGGSVQYYTPQDVAGVSNIRINNPQFGAGMEVGIYTDRENKSCFNLGLDYIANIFTGRVFQTYAGGIETYNTLTANLRFGLGANVVYAYKINEHFGFHIGSRFEMSNIFGKTAEMHDKAGYLTLLDKGNMILNPLLVNDRNIASLRFFGGLSMYFGKR